MRDWLFHVGGVIRESGTVAGILCKSASRSPLHWWDYGASPPGVFRCRFQACCRCRVAEDLAVELNCVAKTVWCWTCGWQPLIRCTRAEEEKMFAHHDPRRRKCDA